MWENSIKELDRVKVNIFIVKELFLLELGRMIKKFKDSLHSLMGISLKEILKITPDIKEFTFIRMEIYMRALGKTISRKDMEN